MRSRTCVYLNVTLTYDVFSVVRETVSDFSKNLPQFSLAF